MKHLTLLSLLLVVTANVHADTDAGLSDPLTLTDEAVSSPAMNIEGQYKVAPPPKRVVELPPPAPRRISASDRLKRIRERLEERNRIMVEKKMEQIRYQQELALAKQLERSMNQTMKSIDSIK